MWTKRYACRVNIPACDLSQALHKRRDSKLGVLRRPKPGNAKEMHLHDEVSVPSRQFYADGFVHDPAITRKERDRLAKILCCGGDVEQQLPLLGD